MIGGLFNLIDLAYLPMLAAIGGNLNAGNTTSTARVGIPAHLERRTDTGGKINGLIVIRSRHGRVNVQLVEDVLWLVPPTTRQTLLGGNVRRQNTIVMIMVMILRFMLQYINVGKPLDHTSTDISRDDKSDGKAMIWLQSLSIGFVRDNNVIGRVHSTGQWYRCTILDEFTPWFLLEGSGTNLVWQILMTNEFHMLACHVGLLDTCRQEQITK